VEYLNKRGVDVVETTGNPAFIGKWDGAGVMKLPANPTELQVKHPLPRGPSHGFLDRFGNEWVRGPSRTKGQAFEWDVQLSRTGRSKLGWATDDNHVNVSLDGRITH